MSTTLPKSDASLLPSLITRVEEGCDRFEAAWKAGLRPRIEDYLGETADPERSAQWHELLVLELVYRRLQGERPRLEEYWTRFPGHVELINRILNQTGPSASHDQQAPTGSDQIKRGYSPPEESITQRSEKEIGKAEWPEVAGYDILAELGHSGMGVVYQARQHQLKRLVALKMIRAGLQARPEDPDRFRLEANRPARHETRHASEARGSVRKWALRSIPAR